jgi:hypothetical protein
MAEGGMAIESPPQFGVLPETFPSVEGDEAEAIRRRLANVSAMNMANPNYTLGLDKIVVKTPEEQTYAVPTQASQVGGYYDSRNANEIVINPTLANINSLKDVPQVVAHEAQHLQDIQSPMYKQNAIERMRKESLQRQIEQNFQKAKGNYPEYGKLNVGYYNTPNTPFVERLSDLAGYEAILPKGQRLVDTPFGKEVFNTPELQNYYHASVRPKEQKMIPTLPTMTDKNPVLNLAKQVQGLSKDKFNEFKARINTGDSYADALYKTLTGANFAEGGEVRYPTPEWKKLYEDMVLNRKPDPATQSYNERLGRETVKLPPHPPKASPTVGLQPRGGSKIPSTQLELFKKKGGNISIDEMRLALMRNK